MKRAMLVARVSTNQQFEKGYSVPTQLEGMRRYCLAQSLAVVVELVDDCSGTIEIFERPGGRQIREAVAAGSIDAVVFYTIDRASRDEDVIDFLLLKRELRDTGIELHFADTGQSGHDSITAIIEYLKVSEAGRELKKIVERTSRGRMAKAEGGHWVGGGQVPYGYRRRGERGSAHLLVLEREAKVVRQIFDWYTGAGGQPPLNTLEIAQRLTAAAVPTPSRGKKGRGWSRDTVRCVLSSPTYIGELGYNGVTAYFPELSVVLPERWATAQEQMERNKALSRRGKKRDYLLAGHLKCTCRRSLIGATVGQRKDGTNYSYYACGAQWSDRHLTTCRTRRVRMGEADEKVWAWLADLLGTEENIRDGLQRLAERRELDLAPRQARLEMAADLIAEAEAKIDRLLAGFGDEADAYVREAVQAKVHETSAVLKSLRAEHAQLTAEMAQGAVHPEDEERILALAAEMRAGIAEADFETKRYLLERLDVQGLLVEDAAGRWLDCSCAVPGWQFTVVLADQSASHNTGSCARVSRDLTRVVIFSASIPLDGRPLPKLDLTAALFTRPPVETTAEATTSKKRQ